MDTRSKTDVLGLLGSDFAPSKRDRFRFVQRREERITTPGEKREITELGIAASRKSRSPLKRQEDVDRTFKLVESGVPLRIARRSGGGLEL